MKNVRQWVVMLESWKTKSGTSGMHVAFERGFKCFIPSLTNQQQLYSFIFFNTFKTEASGLWEKHWIRHLGKPTKGETEKQNVNSVNSSEASAV